MNMVEEQNLKHCEKPDQNDEREREGTFFRSQRESAQLRERMSNEGQKGEGRAATEPAKKGAERGTYRTTKNPSRQLDCVRSTLR